MPKEPVGVFVRGDEERVAYTPAAAVQLRAEGWKPKPAETAPPAPPEKKAGPVQPSTES